jgi:Ala-tRNA(Pro) deacylase
MLILANVVEYLRSNAVAFRLVSNPSPEADPPVAHTVRPSGAVLIDTHLVLIDGRPSLVCVPRGDKVNLLGLRAALRAELIEEEDGRAALPWPFWGALRRIPPLGRLFGAPLIIDRAVARAAVICFEVFDGTDLVEIIYDDFARLELPRVEDAAMAGELPASPLH